MTEATRASEPFAPKPAYDAAKRVCDLFVAVILLLILAPFLLIIAVAVRLSSPGPILFRQKRVGQNGNLFILYKFRSMRTEAQGAGVTAGDDNRITGIGRTLRNWKLDELPQFFNVLKGDMSLVGPRPEAPNFVELYTDEQRSVLKVKPGITGLCQLAYRHEEELLAGVADPEKKYIEELMPAKLAIDLDYVRRRSLALDATILLRTVGVLFSRGS
jgi:lipopolysaccharide/colanic/teichoic acid biosynthesis glycosyltransferase